MLDSLPLVQIHIGTLIVTVVFILLADHDGFAWFRGKKLTLNPRRVTLYHRLIWGGLLLMIGSGYLMARGYFGDLIKEPLFALKMFFVSMLFVNGFVIGRLSKIAIEKPFSEVSPKEKLFLLISGGASTLGWVGATISAIFFFR